MAFNVSGKTAIVTGAGSGINLAFAKLLLDNNCNVVFADLALRPEAEDTVKAFGGDGNAPRAVFQKTDVTDWVQLEAMFDVAERTFGALDIVCPGAGVYEPPFSNFWIPPGTGVSRDDPRGSRYMAMDINVTHPIRCTQVAIAHFVRYNRPGAVVHISSIAAQRPQLSCPLYVAAKAAVSGFVRSLAKLETPESSQVPPIRVTGVAPGVIKTPLWTENPEKLKWIDTERDEWVTAEDVAEVMLDLIQKPEYIGGTILEVGKNQVRRVEVLNDAGPKGAGHTVSGAKEGDKEVWEKLTQSWSH
ncbi:NAD-dependent 15-hydroxyprostaglandin dehydrogenase [Xylariales sp. PMI_506]|nr:NAD-dependent 15-hydroxyprostaglandin dehydrogenase [Xylariales sp. PMI_506]